MFWSPGNSVPCAVFTSLLLDPPKLSAVLISLLVWVYIWVSVWSQLMALSCRAGILQILVSWFCFDSSSSGISRLCWKITNVGVHVFDELSWSSIKWRIKLARHDALTTDHARSSSMRCIHAAIYCQGKQYKNYLICYKRQCRSRVTLNFHQELLIQPIWTHL